MSQVEHYVPGARWGMRGSPRLRDRLERSRATSGGLRYPVEGGMIETAENLRAEYGISRQEQDDLALRSHQRAVAARKAGLFDAETVPVTISVDRGRGEQVVTQDESPRADTTAEQLAGLRPVRQHVDAEATVTPGNACAQNDGASVAIVTTKQKAAELGLRPYARMCGWGVAGVDPRLMGIGPVPATARALKRSGLSLSDIDLIELNEAFAAQVLACTREWEFTDRDFDRLNVNGSGISIGHPVGATGGRILATLLHEMERRGARYGLETMCIGGGQGIAAVFESVPAS